MAQRIAGVAFVKVDGTQYPLRGNFTVSPSNLERQMLAGQDSVHGYSEMPRVPFIEGDISLMPNFSITAAQTIVDSTVTAELANGRTYTLRNATTTAAYSLNTRDGLCHIRWEGLDCNEF